MHATPILLDKLADAEQAEQAKQQDAIQSAQNEFVELAVRDLTGKTRKPDAERLGIVLKLLDRDPSDYARLVESLRKICRLSGSQRFYDKYGAGIEEQAEAVRQLAQAADELRLKLTHAEAGLISLTRNADRVIGDLINAKRHAPFVFDDDGKPVEALEPLIQAAHDRHVARAEEMKREADEALATDLDSLDN